MSKSSRVVIEQRFMVKAQDVWVPDINQRLCRLDFKCDNNRSLICMNHIITDPVRNRKAGTDYPESAIKSFYLTHKKLIDGYSMYHIIIFPLIQFFFRKIQAIEETEATYTIYLSALM